MNRNKEREREREREREIDKGYLALGLVLLNLQANLRANLGIPDNMQKPYTYSFPGFVKDGVPKPWAWMK